MTDTVHTYFTPVMLRDVLQAVGYRVEETNSPIGGAPALRSATAGMAFDVLFANPLPPDDSGKSPGWADVTFQAALQVQGELPLSLVNHWNVTRRFGRLNLLQNLLLLDMDVVAAGGVRVGNVRAQVEIWDQLVQRLIAYLRDELAKLAKAAPVPQSVAGTDAPSPTETSSPQAA